jgi:hypothetical protein
VLATPLITKGVARARMCRGACKQERRLSTFLLKQQVAYYSVLEYIFHLDRSKMRYLFLLYFLSFVGCLSAQKNTVELTVVDKHEKEDSVYYELPNGKKYWMLKTSTFRPFDLLIFPSVKKRVIRKILAEKYHKEKDWVVYRCKKGYQELSPIPKGFKRNITPKV